MNTPLALGQLMISIEGIALDAQSRHRLMHPDIGGVILFSRNYENRQQLIELVQDRVEQRHAVRLHPEVKRLGFAAAA